ncbi:adenine phosphoribosyltransferase 4-like isoform X7 [Salvia miltiorrhiza]|uniref:adenine phosphoribosyltransferase 4-like isoform X7 n=1 Tax=Salvia miltiorrhiza TaxID=226208 RepID=UPI0025AC1619|nr:adenine phosphoribosyltransferase 4-like isoform X7 [Salvia miltiorrhiza]
MGCADFVMWRFMFFYFYFCYLYRMTNMNGSEGSECWHVLLKFHLDIKGLNCGGGGWWLVMGSHDPHCLRIEARGFIFGPPIALAIGAKFVPLRKPKKLPGEVFRQEYDLEYGSDCLEMHVGALASGERALVVDDLIATGGTLCAAMKLLECAGAEVVECACVIEIPALKGRERLNGKPVYVLVDSQ